MSKKTRERRRQHRAANREVDRLLRVLHQQERESFRALQQIRQAADASIAAVVLGTGNDSFRFSRALLQTAAEMNLKVKLDSEDVVLCLYKRQEASQRPTAST